MTDDGFRADAPTIKAHSAQVGEFAKNIETAHQAAETVLDSNAFGVFGQFLVPSVVAQCEAVKDAIDGGAKSLHSLKERLDITAAHYEATDMECGEILKEGGRGL